MTRSLLLLFLSAQMLWLAGCASHSAYIITRRDARYALTSASKITIANHNFPSPQTQELGRALAAELEQLGFHIVPPLEADYTLTYWIEDNWNTVKTQAPMHDSFRGQPGPGGMSMPRPFPAYGWTDTDIYRPLAGLPYATPSRTIEIHIYVQGIRLHLYPQEGLRTGRLQTAWEGYIDAGLKVATEREPLLLKTLLTHFGMNYTGRVKLVE